jgi:hypothetical protein
MKIAKVLAGLGIVGGAISIITGLGDWKKASNEEDSKSEDNYNDCPDEIIIEEETTEEE